MVKVALLFAAGTNCDVEMAQAFELAGAQVTYVHVNEAKKKPEILRRFQVLGIPGGFTYGDYIAAGVILANELRYSLRDEIVRFIDSGKLILGVCNGFQVLVKAGILPGTDAYLARATATLKANDSHRFECRWVYLQPKSSRCVFLSGIERTLYMPVAHAEGRFVTNSKRTLRALAGADQIALTYVPPDEDAARGPCATGRDVKTEYPWNPNGSELDIAGICDPTGRVFGLMPHPERFVRRTQHPRWTRTRPKSNVKCQMSNDRTGSDNVADGLLIYRNAVAYAKRSL